jgi:hypothetical protein
MPPSAQTAKKMMREKRAQRVRMDMLVRNPGASWGRGAGEATVTSIAWRESQSPGAGSREAANGQRERSERPERGQRKTSGRPANGQHEASKRPVKDERRASRRPANGQPGAGRKN